ncbi:MAG: NAD(P)/FAD-dependent oxidoreductase, partial [Clostridia bacterium]|nr:NAD(P)/FAD-dependent oxidoreductase [Clostridia bacterium]
NQVQGPLLFTHKDLSGPSILHVSRYANDDDKLYINYLPDYNVESLRQLFMSAKNEEPKLYLWKFLHREFNLPTSFCKLFAKRFNLGESEFSAITKSDINELCQHLCHDEFTLKPFTAKDFNKAMVSAGGVNLKEIDLKDMSLKKWPDIHVIGEALDVDGDTGGYNLQFAWSSARMAQ